MPDAFFLAAAVSASLNADPVKARAEKGEIVVSITHLERPIRHVRVTGVVNRPADQVYKVFSDFPSYPKVFPYLKTCEVREQTPPNLVTYSTFPMPWPFKERWLVNKVLLNPGLRTLHWDYMKGNIRHYSGVVRVEPAGPNRCVVDLQAQINPNLPWIPKPLVTWMEKNALPNVIVDVRRYLGENVERRWE